MVARLQFSALCIAHGGVPPRCAQTHTHRHVRAHAHTRMHTCTYTHTHSQTHAHTRTHTLTHSQRHMRRQPQMHTQTQAVHRVSAARCCVGQTQKENRGAFEERRL